jgi:hypothetical protein
LWGAAVALLALAVDAASATYGLRARLRAASDLLEQGGAELAGGRYRRAERDFTQARGSARAAGELTGRPSFVLASLLPWVGSNSVAVEALAGAADLTARAGSSAATARAEMGTDVASSLYRDGRVRFLPIRQARPRLGRSERLLRDAAFVVSSAPEPTMAPVAAAIEVARSRLEAASDSVERVATLADALPDLLGRKGPRRYLLAFQTPSEARGTGGLIGFYGVLAADRGRVRLGHVGPIAELTGATLRGVQGPPWFERRYRPLSGLRQFQMVNQSPHFPAVARVLLAMYEGATGARLDGVVAMDPVALGELTAATGPIAGVGLASEIGPNNAAEVLAHDSYVGFGGDGEAQNRYLASVIDAFWERIRAGGLDVAALAVGLGRAVSSGHLKVYAQSPEVERALGGLEADGSVTGDGPNVQLVYHNNFGANKVDYFMRRAIRATVRIDASGAALVDTRLSLENGAPAGEPSVLLGDAPELAPGVNRMVLSFLMPKGAEIRRMSIAGERIAEPWREREAGFPQISELLDVAPEKRTSARIAYRVPGAVSLDSARASFEMTFIPQATVRPDRFELTVIPPYGFQAQTAVDGRSYDGGVHLVGTLDRKRTVELNLVR